MNNFSKTNINDFDFKSKNQIPFEEDYERIKDNPSEVFEKYYLQLEKTLSKLSYMKGVEKEELIQESYEYFLKFCERYDPYYQGYFVQFDRFVFKNIIMSLRAGVQKHYLTKDRERATDSADVPEKAVTTDITNANNQLLVEKLYSYLTDQQRQILELYSKGYKQYEIGEIIGISQSRISSIFKHSIKLLRRLIKEYDFELME